MVPVRIRLVTVSSSVAVKAEDKLPAVTFKDFETWAFSVSEKQILIANKRILLPIKGRFALPDLMKIESFLADNESLMRFCAMLICDMLYKNLNGR